MPEPRKAHTVYYKSQPIVVGGIDVNNKAMKMCLKYDFADDTFKNFASLQKSRFYAGVLELDDYFYVFGGLPLCSNDDDIQPVKTVEKIHKNGGD